ncbi:hypothetical protein BBJ29_009492 [Phytophthora kernoviae]|uniref:HECT domain-containing protein n=1 Tax=Phytophthora kernoviae TaxID=325452 RepID=A0A3F2RC04_9STRA|nr:hypothetical protein BBJ29_009492 [Phytophthora kernoviae]RLN52341.1 hypothetical protein BBP00_00009654 [Phytophthora kernoviae]
MDEEAKALLAELQAAQDEHQRTLVAAQLVRDDLNRARKEYKDAQAAEKAGEEELARAAEALARGLQSLDVTEDVDKDEEDLQSVAPQFVDSLVEHKDDNKEKEEISTVVDVALLGVRVEFPRVEVTLKRNRNNCGGENSVKKEQDVEVVWTTEIERNVDVSQCVVEDKGDHWYLRLPIRSSDKQPLGGFSSFTQVSSAELRPESYVSVCCRGCGAQLVGGDGCIGNFEKVLPLPSANWMDMFDFWGAGIGAFEHIPRDDIHAQRRRVLVGESYVLLHVSDLVSEAAVTDSEGEAAVAPGDNAKEEREWTPLVCAACSERIGLRSAEQPDTVRLHKHLISACGHLEIADKEDGVTRKQEEDVFGKYTIDSILSAKLLEMADSDGIFRYVLTPGGTQDLPNDDNDSSPPPANASLAVLQLQLLSWETMIKQQQSSKFCRVLKVLYAPRQTIKPVIPDILPSREVTLPPSMCLSIAQRLEVSSTLLPSSLRAFNRMHVGYLFA